MEIPVTRAEVNNLRHRVYALEHALARIMDILEKNRDVGNK